MHPLQITMIMSATTMLLISALLILIRTMPSRPGLIWWLYGSILQTVIYLFAINFFGEKTSVAGTIIFYCLAMGVSLCLSIGTLLFAKVAVDIKRRLALLALSIFAAVSLVLTGQLFLASLVMAVFNGTFLLHTAFTIYPIHNNQISFKTTAILMGLNAAHWLDYPFLITVEWFVPIGFMLGMILLASIFLNLTVCALLQFKQHTQESEHRAILAATTDSLTGLYNRSHLQTLFDNYVKEADQIERSFILLYFDLDGFKQINDVYGHKAGDLILTTISERMSNWLGAKGDAIRIGGDELIVLTRLRGNYERKNAVTAAEQLLAAIEEPIVGCDDIFQISASIGGCCYGLPLDNLDDMLNKSDKLMYGAKQAGGGRIYFSHSTFHSSSSSSTLGCKNELSVDKNSFYQSNTNKTEIKEEANSQQGIC